MWLAGTPGNSALTSNHNIGRGPQFWRIRPRCRHSISGLFRGTCFFNDLPSFALGQYELFNQASGNPAFIFSVPYYGYLRSDTFRVLPTLTLHIGLREDFQVSSPPSRILLFHSPANTQSVPALGPRIGFAWQPIDQDRCAGRIWRVL